MSDSCDIAIVGAGAAGLAAGIFAAEAAQKRGRSIRIAILEGARRPGAKILVSGGGRCNVTNASVTPGDFNGSRNIVRNIIAGFDSAATVRWMASLGVALKQEEHGKLFPVTDKATTVLEALFRRCRELDVPIMSGRRVADVQRAGGGFEIVHEQGRLLCRRLILATGGRSLPKTGSDGQGWEIVRRLGHSVTDTYPALVPLVLHGGFFDKQLSGISVDVELSTFADGKLIDRRTGSLLWTHFGTSGPVVLDASLHWIIARAQGRRPTMACSFLPGESFEQGERWLVELAGARPRHTVAGALAGRLPHRLAEALSRHAEVDPATALANLDRAGRRRIVHALTHLPLPVTGDRGWNYAEVTAGGVPLDEIDYRTMESRRTPGLHLAGEMLDCDGRIGGFNFQWAWATGHVAGRGAACSGTGGPPVSA